MPKQTLEDALAEAQEASAQVVRWKRIRTRAIKSARSQGATLRQIAEATGLSKDTVRKLE